MESFDKKGTWEHVQNRGALMRRDWHNPGCEGEAEQELRVPEEEKAAAVKASNKQRTGITRKAKGLT